MSPTQQEAPSTPVRGRPASRYPAALSKGEPGRVPLHRRGTSRTLETLEDLLRENGYKETRVFTPEAERIDSERRRQSTWRIRELLSGWLPGATASEPPSDDEQTPGPRKSHAPTTPTRAPTYHSTPNSPLSNKRRLPRESGHPIASPNSASSTTLSSMRSGTTTDSRAVSYQPTRRHLHDRIPAIRAELTAANLRTYAQVSAAQGYLRHMASTPNMTKRPAPSTRDSSVDRAEPPLPASWLESVTKAMLRSGDSGARIGGPLSRPGSRLSLRTTRGVKENVSVTELTPKPPRTAARSSSRLPPGASLYLHRAPTAPSAVNAAHVMCRSAPGSRSTSRVGERAPGGGAGSLRRKDRQERGRRGARNGHADRVPSLASTRVEDDTWANMYWVDGRRVSVVHHDDGHHDGADSDDDDDGELDLARLLVPPKRQYSIQSLRKHLHVAHRQNRPTTLAIEGWEEDDAPARGHGHQVIIDDSDGYPTFRSDTTKRRRGLPGAWGVAGSSRS